MDVAQAPLTLRQAIELAPAIATDHPHPWKGEGFVHLNTQHMVEAMLDNGFAIRSVSQAKGRIGNGGIHTGLYNQHVVRMREASSFHDVSVGDSIPEVLLINSHDGSGCFTMTAGLYRLVCSNGMVVGESFEAVKYRHRWTDPNEIVGEAQRLWERVPALNEWRSRALKRELSQKEQASFAQKAQVIRFPTATSMPFDPKLLLDTRRPEDKGNDLWHTFQRVQENVIRGGIAGRSATGRVTQSRSITGVGSDIEINQALWDTADQFLQAA